MKIEEKLKIGRVSLWPYQQIVEEWKDRKDYGFLKNLNNFRHTVASSLISAEPRKAGFILQDEVEQVLKIIRFFAAIVYWDRPTQYVFLEGKNPSRIANVIYWNAKGQCGYEKLPLFNPLPIEINEFFLTNCNNYGLDYVLQSCATVNKNPLQQIILNSIYWYGDAVQDSNSLSSFMKYYTALESLLKDGNENAMSTIPERTLWILEKYGTKSMKTIRNELESIVIERNSVFHQGKPQNYTEDELKNKTHDISRNIMCRFILMTQNNNWSTKDDFKNWVTLSKNSYKNQKKANRPLLP